MSRFPRLLVLLAPAVLLLSNCGTLIPSRAQRLVSIGFTSVPLVKAAGDSRYSGKFLVNRRPVHLLIDSGANSTDIDARLGKSVGLRVDHRTKVVSRGALGRSVTSRLGYGELQIGPAIAQPFAFSMAPPTGSPTATSRYHGQMGLDAFSRLSALIDLREGKMWIPTRRAINNRNGDIRSLGLIKGLALDAVRLDRAGHLPHLVYQGTHQGQRLTWIVDTGAEATVLSQAAARRLGVPTAASRSRIIDASGDHASVRIGRLRNIRFGALNIGRFEVAVTDLSTVRRSFRDSSGRPIDGILGMDFLENSHALLDSKSRLLYLGSPGY